MYATPAGALDTALAVGTSASFAYTVNDATHRIANATLALGNGHPSPDAVTIIIDPADIEWSAIRAQGAGGQNVNKVSTAVHLRFDIRASGLPAAIKARLLAHGDQRISNDGVVVIKAQRYRSQDRNREDAIMRLREFIDGATAVPRARKATKPTRSSQRRRVDSKVQRGKIKVARGRIDP